MALAAIAVQAQDDDVLRHCSLSAGIGTSGITVDVAGMLTDRAAVRAGIDIMPKIKCSADIEMTLVNQTVQTDISNIPWSIEVQGRLSNTTGHALIDFHPVGGAPFRITAGAYFTGHSKVMTVTNKEEGALIMMADFNARRGDFAMVPASYGQVAARMGQYNIMPDDRGNATASLHVNKFRPYLGVGYGRAVPKRSRLACLVDLGVQYLGRPHVYNDVNGEELIAEKAGDKGGGWLKNIGRIRFYPVVTVRLVGRLF